MAKLIHSSIECGWRVIGICFHTKRNLNVPCFEVCKPINEENFPPTCPLEEGSIKRTAIGSDLTPDSYEQD